MFRHFRRMYEECGEKEVRNLVEAIKNDKYWSGRPGVKDVIYIVALTKAEIPLAQGFQARATFLGKVTVSREASPYCRRGRVLAAVKSESQYIVQSVITWPAFLRIMREKAEEAYHLLISGRFPAYLDSSDLGRIFRDQGTSTIKSSKTLKSDTGTCER